MVKWEGREGSGNVVDRRGARASSGGAGSAGLVAMLLRMVISRFGIGGVAVLAVGFIALQSMGLNPLALLSGPSAGPSAPVSAADAKKFEFAKVVLKETEIVWSDFFRQSNETYPEPQMVIFSGQDNSACGFASAAAGPFYCPADRRIYLDTDFFDELANRFGAPGDFAGAYVIAHEVGHHVQTVTGVASKVRAAQERARPAEANALQVKMELQADCYAGVWAKSAAARRDFLEEGDIEEGLRAASAIGDDTLQRNAGRRVTPESFTHGTSEQRKTWFYRGFEQGDPRACDTFAG